MCAGLAELLERTAARVDPELLFSLALLADPCAAVAHTDLVGKLLSCSHRACTRNAGLGSPTEAFHQRATLTGLSLRRIAWARTTGLDDHS